jgi:hypothetical protein
MTPAELRALRLIADEDTYRNGVRTATIGNLNAKGLITVEHYETIEWYSPRGFCSRGETRSRTRVVARLRITEAGRKVLAS